MAVFLERVDSAPLTGTDFTFEFMQWVSVLVDTLNETIVEIENRLNVLEAPQYETAQITALAVDAPNGSQWYDTTTNQLKAKVNGVVIVLA